MGLVTGLYFDHYGGKPGRIFEGRAGEREDKVQG